MERKTEPKGSALPQGGRWSIYGIAFFSGMAIILEELLVPGWLAPVFGSGLQVWGAVIGWTLLALAAGYFMASFLIPWASFWVVALLLSTAALVEYLVLALYHWLYSSGLVYPTMGGLLFFSFLLLFFPLACLAALAPLLVELLSFEAKHAGRASSFVYSLSTLGSVLGAFLGSFYTIPFLGLWGSFSVILWILAASLWNTFLEPKRKKIVWSCLAVVFFLIVLSYLFPFPAKPSLSLRGVKRVFLKDTWYGRHEVYQGQGRVLLVVNGVVQTGMPRAGVENLPPLSLLQSGYVMELLPLFFPKGKKALVLGLGGGFFSSYFKKWDWQIDSVELDPLVVFLARKFFGFQGNVFLEDARSFLWKTKNSYDFILLDTFLGAQVPPHLVTLEFFDLVASRLTPQGILAINWVGSPKGKGTRAIVRTLQRVFPYVLVYEPYQGEVGIMTLFARKVPFPREKVEEFLLFRKITLPDPLDYSAKELEEVPLLTDDKNSLLWLHSEDLWAWRQYLKEQF